MLFVLLCGEFPFMGNSENDVIRVISTGRPNWQPLVTAPAKDLITKMLAKKPEDRLSIDEVLAHPWLALPEGAPTESQPFVKVRVRVCVCVCVCVCSLVLLFLVCVCCADDVYVLPVWLAVLYVTCRAHAWHD